MKTLALSFWKILSPRPFASMVASTNVSWKENLRQPLPHDKHLPLAKAWYLDLPWQHQPGPGPNRLLPKRTPTTHPRPWSWINNEFTSRRKKSDVESNLESSITYAYGAALPFTTS